MTAGSVLVVNTGSTSVKLAVVAPDDALVAKRDLGPVDEGLGPEVERLLRSAGPVDAVAHRVVHGGPRFHAAVVVDPDIRRALGSVQDLAPLHDPPAITGIDITRALIPDVPTVACFDTAFHATMPAVATAYAVPEDWVRRWGIRRYGFHGLSCAWAARRAGQLLGATTTPGRLVICHLGGGASVTAVAAGRSVDTTMGFTPLEGLVMATRAGDVDPGAVVHVLRHGLTAEQADVDLERRSGLLGLSGTSGDLRDLLRSRRSGDGRASFAIDVYLHRLRAKIAAMAAAMGGMDALVFTGGVGQHLGPVRSGACRDLAWLGVALDHDRNDGAAADAVISAASSDVAVLVVEAREDLEMVREARRLLPHLGRALPAQDGRPR